MILTITKKYPGSGIVGAAPYALLCSMGRQPLTLTERERMYIVLVCRCPEPSMAEMAQHMGITPKTLEKHRAKAYRKLGVHTRLELYLKAVQLGLVKCACGGGRTNAD